VSAGRFSFDYVRSRYGVPAKRGGRVKFRGMLGTLTSGAGNYVRVRLDGEERSIIVHPTWEMEYLPAVPLKEPK